MKKIIAYASLAIGAACAALMIGAPWTGARTPPLLDRELFFESPGVSSAKFSPDGRYIAFIRSFDGNPNIWVRKVEDRPKYAYPVTAATDRPIVYFRWTVDSRRILFLKDDGGDENFHLYSVDPSTLGAATDLTPYGNVKAEILCQSKSRPNVVYVGMNDRDVRYHDVFEVNVFTGERTLVRQNDAAIRGWIFDQKGELRLSLHITDDGSTQLFRLDENEPSLVFECSKTERAHPFGFHADGKRLYMASNKGSAVDLLRLVLLDVETGDEKVVESDPEGEVDFDAVYFAPDTDELVGTAYAGDRWRMYWRDAEYEKDYNWLTRALPEGDVFIRSATLANDRWIVSVCSDTESGAAYLVDRSSHTVEPLGKTDPSPEFFSPMTPIKYMARDGLEIHGYLTLPKGVKPHSLPLVVFPHGGPWDRDFWGYDAMVQFLANRGYAVLQVNFRGSSGYGKRFLNAGNKQWGDAMQNDITDGVAYVTHQLGIADPKRVAIFGLSYGGYAALAGLAFSPELYAAGISFAGPSDLVGFLQTVPPYWTVEKGRIIERMGSLDNPDDVARLRRQSPLFSAQKITAPLLVIQGANDSRVRQAETDQLVASLRALGRDVEYLVMPNEGHTFFCFENKIAFTVAIEKFLAKHLGGRCQEDVPKPIAERLRSLQQ